jgi:hypothetical protein
MADSGWIVTYTGKQFYPLNPRIDDICIEDIAHGLSNICRFTGQVSTFYSVAEHSCRATMATKEKWLRLALLLHDASEAYLCDISRPVKHHPDMAFYREAEKCLQAMIGQKFGVEFSDPLIHEIDDRMLMTERRDLMPPSMPWGIHQQPYDSKIVPLHPVQAEYWFLGLFRTLNP